MLYEEQAAELLRRCEALAGRTLHQLRGNLAKASTRAEAVWELLVVEAASQLGEVECEAPHGGPDIRLLMPSGRWVSVEVTYLHPRFEGEQRRWRLVTGWMAEAESTIGPREWHLNVILRVGGPTPLELGSGFHMSTSGSAFWNRLKWVVSWPRFARGPSCATTPS
jgi:hypothetical protein